ncbi:MAG: hypothetical protein ACKOJF_00525, partial [Planctomycetaceae bacterium]
MGSGALASSSGLVGCGGTTHPASSNPRPVTGYRLGLIGRHRDSVTFRAAAAAARQRAAELSASLEIPVEVSVLAPERDDPAAQVEWIEQLVREEAAGIAIEVAEAESLRQAVASSRTSCSIHSTWATGSSRSGASTETSTGISSDALNSAARCRAAAA